jgi:Transposase DNA-binding
MHFGKAQLFDQRRTRRLVKAAELIMAHPQGTLPTKLAARADLVGLYRLTACEDVTHANVLEAHRQWTLQRMREHAGVVLVVHDTTELDYSSIQALSEQLGQIGNGSRRGYLCHNSLALALNDHGGRQVLGLASQILHKRRDVPRGESLRAKREHPGRESRLWVRGCEQVGPAPAGKLWVDVCDRGADTIEFIEHEIRQGRHFVIRVSKDRTLEGDDHLGADRIHRKLRSYVQDQPALGQRQVRVPAVPGRRARQATVAFSSGAMRLRAGRFARGQCRGDTLDLWVVRVWETDAPAGVQPLEWMLLSDLPSCGLDQATEKVDWYEHRPVIEDYHKGAKTGLGIEESRFTDASHLEPVIALLSVVTVVLLGLRDAGRQPNAEQTPAQAMLPAVYVLVLAGCLARRAARLHRRAHPPPGPDMSLRQFSVELAKLGGFMGRKSDGSPGWLTLWRGWEKLQLMIEGYTAMN